MTGITIFCVRAAPFLETGGFPKRVIRRPFNRSGTSTEMPSADSSLLTAQSSTLQMSVAQAETVSSGINSLPTSLHGNCSKASQWKWEVKYIFFIFSAPVCRSGWWATCCYLFTATEIRWQIRFLIHVTLNHKCALYMKRLMSWALGSWLA